MKKLIYLLSFIFCLLSMANAQYGDQIHFGNTFASTDSTLLSAYVDSTAADGATIYSGLVYMGKLYGSYGVTYLPKAVSGTPTFTLSARFWYKAGSDLDHWSDDWETVFSGAAVDVRKFIKYTSGSSLTWWHQADGIQFRIVQSGAGDVDHYVGHYPR